MNKILQCFTICTASLALSCASTSFNSAQAAAINYTFQTSIDSGSLLGNTYLGSLSYDDSSLVGSGSEFIPVSEVSFNFEGVNYTNANSAEVSFFDGDFLGLSFSPVPLFSITPGFFDLSEALFAYDLSGGNGGFGNVLYTLTPTSVPEPTTVVSLLILGTWGAFSSLKLKN